MDNQYTQNQLPSDVFNASSGDVRTFNGQQVRVTVNSNGTRSLSPVSGGSIGGGGGGSTANVPFNFDWAAARQKAFDSLTPYYQQKLDLAKGDVELAKKYIEQDYQQGLRYSNDTYNTTTKYTNAEGANNIAQEQVAQGQETRDTAGQANNRGVYSGQLPPDQSGNAAPQSNYYSTYIGDPMQQRQQLRMQAIQRAIDKQNEFAGIDKQNSQANLDITRNKGLDTQDQSYRDTQLSLGQEQKDKAYNEVAPEQYQEAATANRAANNLSA